jgi:uncharacterized domain HDIG
MDKEYLSSIEKIVSNRKFKKLENEIHHHTSNRLKHCMDVSYISYKICKGLKLDSKSAARAGLLHDFFLNDEFNNKATRLLTHGEQSIINANKITTLNEKEKDIISSHMFPIGGTVPKCPESVIVDLVDDYVAFKELVVGNARLVQAAAMYLVIVLTEIILK